MTPLTAAGLAALLARVDALEHTVHTRPSTALVIHPSAAGVWRGERWRLLSRAAGAAVRWR